jgi:hypothetical protein
MKLSQEQELEIFKNLKIRFEQNMNRHKGLEWAVIENKLQTKFAANPEKLWSLNEMELSGGEPDVVSFENDLIVFFDCSDESPKGRRSLCYDKKAWDYRKENKPSGNAMDMASEMGIKMLDEKEYRQLQELGKFDLKTSSWIITPEKIRNLGGAVFCDRRYDTVFYYHNGAESYYAARGFRGKLVV